MMLSQRFTPAGYRKREGLGLVSGGHRHNGGGEGKQMLLDTW